MSDKHSTASLFYFSNPVSIVCHASLNACPIGISSLAHLGRREWWSQLLSLLAKGATLKRSVFLVHLLPSFRVRRVVAPSIFSSFYSVDGEKTVVFSLFFFLIPFLLLLLLFLLRLGKHDRFLLLFPFISSSSLSLSLTLSSLLSTIEERKVKSHFSTT